MSDVMTPFYRGLLDGAPSTALQHRVLDYALRRKDQTLLATLANLANLDPTIDEALGQVSASRVQAAWVRRAGRDPELLSALALSDKRIGVLTELAALPALSPEAYQHLSEVANFSVAKSLTGNLEAPLPVRVRAARAMGSLIRRPSSRRSPELDAVLVGEPEILEAFAADAVGVDALEVLVGIPALTAPVQELLVPRALALLGNAPPETSEARRAVHVLRSLAESSSLESTAALALVRGIGELRQYVIRDDIRRHLLAAAAAPRAGGSTATRAAEARSTADLDRLGVLVAQATTQRRMPVLVAAALNPHVTPELVRQLVPHIGYQEARLVLARRATEPGLVLEVLVNFPYFTTDPVLGRTGSPGRVLSELVKRRLEAGMPVMASLASSRYLTTEVTALLPVQFLSREEIPVTLREEATRLLVDSFGTHTPSWDTFESLANGFEGSLGDLVAAVVALVGEPDEDQHADPPAPPARRQRKIVPVQDEVLF